MRAPILPTRTFPLSRRRLLQATGVLALAGAGLPARLLAAEPIKTAAIYTVPVEQQWVSRIHKAAETAAARGDIEYTFTENTSNTDYERVMREYAEAGNTLIVGEVFGVEQAARTVALDYPEVAFLMGSSLPPDPAYPNFAVFDNYIQDASYLTGIIAGAMSASGKIGVVGGFPIPEVNRLIHAFMAGVRETKPDATFQVAFIGSWFDPPKAGNDRRSRGTTPGIDRLRADAGHPAGSLVHRRLEDLRALDEPGAGGGGVPGQDLVELQAGADQPEAGEALQLGPGQLVGAAVGEDPQPVVARPSPLRGDVDPHVDERAHRARGQPVAADLVAGELRLLQQQHVAAGGGQAMRRRRPRRAGTDDDDVGVALGSGHRGAPRSGRGLQRRL